MIVYSAEEDNAFKTATQLQTGLKALLGTELTVVPDTEPAVSCEIVIGNADRSVKGVTLNFNEYCAYTDGGRLVITAGHNALLTTAAAKFLESAQAGERIPELSGRVADFVTEKTVSGTAYAYTWGDEFNTSSLDTDTWSFKGADGSYGVPADIERLTDERCVSVNDGNLSLRTILYESEDNADIKYANSWSITTEKAMSYKYGYLEMYAKVPVVKGAWCSMWLTSGGSLGTQNADYGVEVDVFESAAELLVPNLHKWYTDTGSNIYDVAYNSSPASKYNDATSSSKKIQKCDIAQGNSNFRNEYHLFAFEWTPEKMVMYVDGASYMTFDLTDDYENYDKTANASSGGMSGFHDPMQVILGCGIYSNRYVNPYNTWATDYMLTDDTLLPLEYTVDWIRLYQKTGEGELNTR